jgi:hypothetical protein
MSARSSVHRVSKGAANLALRYTTGASRIGYASSAGVVGTVASVVRMDHAQPRRRAAAAAGLAVLVGALIMLVALVAVPGPWLRGYVSEAGTAGQPYAVAYRAGLILLAGGVLLLGSALRPATRLAAGLLGGAGVLAGLSGAVPCSDRCPLPPFEPTTVADVVHTAAGIAGMAVLAGAMLAVAVSPLRAAARRLAGYAAAVTVPIAGALGLIMLFVGRGQLGASLERLLLVVAVSWLVGTALVASLG